MAKVTCCGCGLMWEIAERCAVSEKAIERQITLALKFIKENLPLFVVFMG